VSQDNAVRFLHDQCLVDLFGDKAIGYLAVTRTVRQLSWTAPERPNGRPVNISIDAAILKVLNGDATASMREITQEAKLSPSTIFYVLTTRMDNIYRRCRLAPHNLSEPQKLIVSGKVTNF
jgi:hypothetical protein